MGDVLTTFDVVIFLGSLVAVMVVGLWAGRKEDTSEDYYLAGKSTRWWGVAGSIFGTNISANHMVGMMAIGFTFGFVESHFEITAIAGLLMLCYGFLPVYRKLNIYTLSEYLSKRYNDTARVLYTVIMVAIIVFVMMLPAFYIGSRAVNILLVDDAQINRVLEANAQAATETAAPAAAPAQGQAAPAAPPKPVEKEKIKIRKDFYIYGVLIMAFVTGTYTIFGGLKAVIITDVIQSVLMLIAAIIVALLTFHTAEIGGWSGMRALDTAANGGKELMHLYLPSNHPARPWTGMFSGLMILHFYYWGTNQFIVQRALSARSGKEARFGIITAGFFKLLVPFVSIGTGVAAYYYFRDSMPNAKLDGDIAFPMLMRHVVKPVGAGLVGLVAAGLMGAILSSVDSYLNSAATLITFDIYKRFINPDASEHKLIWMGRALVAFFVIVSAVMTIIVFDPNTDQPFFNYVASQQSKLVSGLVVAFAMGMWWKRGTPWGGAAAIIAGVVFSYAIPPVYAATLGKNASVAALFGAELNFFHAVFLAGILSALTLVVVSLLTQPDAEKSKLTWTELGGHNPRALSHALISFAIALVVFAVLGYSVHRHWLAPVVGGLIAALMTWGLFIRAALGRLREAGTTLSAGVLVAEDRIWGGLLASLAVFMLYYFY